MKKSIFLFLVLLLFVNACKTSGNQKTETYCTNEQKKTEVCSQIFKPVCGWFDSKRIQCFKYPCAQTFSNSCFACADSKVLYWTDGACPK